MPITPVIDSAIPQLNYELIRDQIGGILLAEFGNQKDNYGLAEELCPSNVYIGRFVDVDDQEFPMMTVKGFRGKYVDHEGRPTIDSSGQRPGFYTYVIDIVTGSPSAPDYCGDEKASTNLDRIMGIAMSILSDTRYDTLGFDPDDINIRRSYIGDFIVNMPTNSVNTADMIWGKIYLYVECVETVALPQPGGLAVAEVIVGLRDQDNKFYWTFLQKKIAITTTGTTLTDAFFSESIKSIDLVNADNVAESTYVLDVDYTQSGTTITAITFEFTAGTNIIAKK